MRVLVPVSALGHGESGHLLPILLVPFQPAGVRDRHALARTTEPVRSGELRRAVRVGAGQVLIGAAGVVHRPPHHRMRAHPGEQGVDGLLDRAADIDRVHLDLPGQVRELQHRHHAVDRHDGDAVHHRVPRRRQLRVCRQPVDVRHGQPGVFDGGLDRLKRMRGQGDLRRPGDVGKSHAAHRDLAPVLPHAMALRTPAGTAAA